MNTSIHIPADLAKRLKRFLGANENCNKNAVLVGALSEYLDKYEVNYFPETTLEEVAGCLEYKGEAKTLEEMEAAIAKGVVEDKY